MTGDSSLWGSAHLSREEGTSKHKLCLCCAQQFETIMLRGTSSYRMKSAKKCVRSSSEGKGRLASCLSCKVSGSQSLPSYSWVQFCQLTQVFKDHGTGSTPLGSRCPPVSMCAVDKSTAMSRTPGPHSREWQNLPLLHDLAQMLTMYEESASRSLLFPIFTA